MDDERNLQWIPASEAKRPVVRPAAQPKMDRQVSEILGFNVPVNHPKLVKLVAIWKKRLGNGEGPEQMDNLMERKEFISELKKAFQ